MNVEAHLDLNRDIKHEYLSILAPLLWGKSVTLKGHIGYLWIFYGQNMLYNCDNQKQPKIPILFYSAIK